ncbi:hypothetical protein SpCBS45565_g06933 [Spizellomyces sp. 'palustris']|nr:hypothetical protein SpCBS45565_g06933 [Spizellomyces sp. 'palustris']
MTPLHRWTGLSSLLTLVPTRTSSRAALGLSMTNMLLSAGAIALHNSNCSVPVFVPTGPEWKNMFAGTGRGPRRWKMIHAPYVPPQYSELESLVELVQDKMEQDGAQGPLTVSMALSFQIIIDEDEIEWREYISSPDTVGTDLTDHADEEEDGTEVITLPFGPASNPVRSITLEALFPAKPPQSYMGEVDPWAADWRVSLDVQEPPGDGLLSGILKRAMDAKESESRIVPDNFSESDEQIPGRIKSVAHVGIEAKRALVDMNDIEDAVQALWRSDTKPPTTQPTPPKANVPSTATLISQAQLPVYVPQFSLLWNLSLRLLDAVSPESCLRFDAGMGPMLKGLWPELCREFRLCWDVGMPIPGVWAGEEGVELKWNILYQKLQMLNWCIKVRRERGGYDTQIDVSEKQPEKEEQEDGKQEEQVHESSVLSLSQRVMNSLTAAVTSLDPGNSKSSTSTNESTLVRLFDRLTSDDTFLSNGDAANMQQPQVNRPTPPPPQRVCIPRGHPALEATSWGSDRSWEDLKKREMATGSQGSGGVIVGSLGARSFGSFEEAVDMADFSAEIESQPKHHPDDTDGDEIFFDTMEDVDVDSPHHERHATQRTVSRPPIPRSETSSSWERPKPFLTDSFITIPSSAPQERIGDKAPLKIYLLSDPTTPIYEPHLQHPGPMTEDMIQNLQSHLSALGTTHEAAIERMRIQSRQLKSDMEAFKAANPGCGLEDFVRWYSPRDWVEEAEGRGGLSGRMKEPGNLWGEIWKTSLPISADMQAPLFDHTQVANQVLSYLDSLSTYNVLTILLRTMILIVYSTLSTHPLVARLPSLETAVRQLASVIDDEEEFFKEAKRMELMLGVAVAGWSKFKDDDLINTFLECSPLYCHILTREKNAGIDSLRQIVGRVFTQDRIPSSFPNPQSREYIFWKEGRRKAYALLRGGEFRVVECDF